MSKDSPWDLRLLVTLIVVVVTRNTNIEDLKFQGSGHITSRHFIPHDLLISRHNSRVGLQVRFRVGFRLAL